MHVEVVLLWEFQVKAESYYFIECTIIKKKLDNKMLTWPGSGFTHGSRGQAGSLHAFQCDLDWHLDSLTFTFSVSKSLSTLNHIEI